MIASRALPYGRFGGELYLKGFTFDSSDAGPDRLSLQPWIQDMVIQVGRPRWLVVGRGFASLGGSDSTSQQPSLDEPPFLFFCDRFGGAFQGPGKKVNTASLPLGPSCPPPHLWMDFNDVGALRLLPSAIFDRIVIDWSTWRYLLPLKKACSQQSDELPYSTVLDHWWRILRPNGDLVFEGGISSVHVVSDPSFKPISNWTNVSIIPSSLCLPPSPQSWLSYDLDNPTHATLTESAATYILSHAMSSSSFNAAQPKYNEHNASSMQRHSRTSANPIHRLLSSTPEDPQKGKEPSIVSKLVARGRIIIPAPKPPSPAAPSQLRENELMDAAKILADHVLPVVDQLMLSLFHTEVEDCVQERTVESRNVDAKSGGKQGHLEPTWRLVEVVEHMPYPLSVTGVVPRWVRALK
ncbi:hypothetical protein HDU67_004978 [Dinochytrium kinnereticum]|nr:hypothetical protein HDU67_004978 [Dinochytrium kinnereticum]